MRREFWKWPGFDSVIENVFVAIAAVFLIQLTVMFCALMYFGITGKSIGG